MSGHNQPRIVRRWPVLNWQKGRLTTKELSKESVYQQNFVEWKGALLNSGRKIETNCLTASTTGSGNDKHSAGGRGTDHWPFCV